MKMNKTINFGKYLMICFIGLSIALIGCDDSVPKKSTEEPENNFPTNTIATTAIKEVTLPNFNSEFTFTVNWATFYYAYSSFKNYVAILYERFDFMICIGYSNGCFCIIPCERHNGSWIIFRPFYSHDRYSGVGDKSFFYDMGKMTGLFEITSKNTLPGLSQLCPTRFSITEKGGYQIVYKTEDNDLKHIRLWLKNYSEDSNGTIQSITVQYQLF